MIEADRLLIHFLKKGPARIEQEELLDLGYGSLADVKTNLDEMWQINRYLGGLHALTHHLYPRMAALPGTITLADLGTGSAHMARAITQWAHKQHLKLNVLAVDWASRNLSIAQESVAQTPEITLLQADANRLPFPAESVDFVVSTLFLHHFPPEQIIKLLRTAHNCARRSVIMSDLTRDWFSVAGFKLIQPVFARHYLTRKDGALSIRRAYTPAELLELAHAAGLNHAQVHTHWPGRMTLVADK